MPDISFWNKCNNKCIMCTNPREYSLSSPIGNYDLKTQIKKINLYLTGVNDIYYSNRDRKDYINITGGEPTTHPNFFPLIKYISDKMKNIPITILTNGRRLSDERFTKKLSSIADERFTIAVSLHSFNKKTFEKITGVRNSYEETLKGIINLSKYFPGSIEIRIVIHNLNIGDLERTILFVKDILITHKNWYIVIIHYEIEGVAEENKEKIKLKLKESAEVLKNIDIDILKSTSTRLYHFPLCVLDQSLRKYAWVTLPKEEVVYTKKCQLCKLQKKCVGLMKRYYELYGDEELKAIR